MKWLLASFFLFFGGALAAQQTAGPAVPPTTAEVMKFYEVMHLRQQTQTMLEVQQKQIKIMMNDVLTQNLPGATAKQRQHFQQMMDSMVGNVFKDYPIDEILRDMVPVYQKHLTENDLAAIVTFYSSPVGQKLFNEMPAMTSEAMRVSYARLQPRIEQMMKEAEQRAKEMGDSDREPNPPAKQ